MEQIKKTKSWLKGKKTFIIAGLMVAVSLVELLTGEITLVQFIDGENLTLLLEGTGLATIRAGIDKLLANGK